MNELTKKALTNVVLGGSMVAGMLVVKTLAKVGIDRYKKRAEEAQYEIEESH